MTNKSLFVVIFTISLVGLIGGANIIYKQFHSTAENEEYNVNQLNQKLTAAENQIRIIVNENNALRTEVNSLRKKIDNISKKLGGFGRMGDYKEDLEEKSESNQNTTRET